jgi:hypothetical protein
VSLAWGCAAHQRPPPCNASAVVCDESSDWTPSKWGQPAPRLSNVPMVLLLSTLPSGPGPINKLLIDGFQPQRSASHLKLYYFVFPRKCSRKRKVVRGVIATPHAACGMRLCLFYHHHLDDESRVSIRKYRSHNISQNITRRSFQCSPARAHYPSISYRPHHPSLRSPRPRPLTSSNFSLLSQDSAKLLGRSINIAKTDVDSITQLYPQSWTRPTTVSPASTGLWRIQATVSFLHPRRKKTSRDLIAVTKRMPN